MNRVFIKKLVTAILFVLVLFTGAILNLKKTSGEVADSVKKETEKGVSIRTLINNTETILNENAFAKYTCIESYGYVQRLLGKKEENDFEVIKDNQGSLHLTYFARGEKDVSALAEEVKTFEANLINPKTKVLYVMPPDKYLKGYTTTEPGLPYDYANETADALLSDLTELGIDSIDFRDTIQESGIPLKELFFKTDHHWSTQTAFWAYTELVRQLQESYGLNVENADMYTELSNYNVVTYENSFVGSLGRKTGVYYSGVDDYSLIYPKFETEFSFDGRLNETTITAEGRFEEALLNLVALRSKEDKYDVQSDRYSTYLYGHQAITHITNHKVTDGPKILLVKDSYMVPVAAFLSTICSDIYLVDPRYYEGSISDYANSIKDLDYALISFYPQNLTEEFFRLNEAKQ